MSSITIQNHLIEKDSSLHKHYIEKSKQIGININKFAMRYPFRGAVLRRGACAPSVWWCAAECTDTAVAQSSVATNCRSCPPRSSPVSRRPACLASANPSSRIHRRHYSRRQLHGFKMIWCIQGSINMVTSIN